MAPKTAFYAAEFELESVLPRFKRGLENFLAVFSRTPPGQARRNIPTYIGLSLNLTG